MTYLQNIALLILALVAAGCAAWTGIQKRYVVCSYDAAWDAALDAVKDRRIATKDKDEGVIETGWLEVPMEGRTFGAFQREMRDSKDRSRIHMKVKRMDDVVLVNFNEERERWVFRGGSRLFGWAPAESSDEVLGTIQTRLDSKFKEHGCTLT